MRKKRERGRVKQRKFGFADFPLQMPATTGTRPAQSQEQGTQARIPTQEIRFHPSQPPQLTPRVCIHRKLESRAESELELVL